MITRRILKYVQRLLVNTLSSSALVSPHVRPWIWRFAGIRVDDPRSTCIESGCHVRHFNLRLGPGVFINRGVSFYDDSLIDIGANVSIAMDALLCTATHEVSQCEMTGRAGRALARSIVVGDGCWLGARCVVLPGVCIGAMSIVGALSLVRASCEPNSVVTGIPGVAKAMSEIKTL